MRRLTDEPGRGGADIGTDFGHNGRTAHIQQTVPGRVELVANQRNAIEPGEIRQRDIPGGDQFYQRNTVIYQAIYQQRNRDDEQ